jgi:hypothetical protein
MMDNGRLEELMERLVIATERMAADPEIEIEGGPPICPGCGKMNPVVELPEQQAGRGPLAEIAIEATCTHCGGLVIAIPESYSMHRVREQAIAEIKAKAASFNE